jgi:futalosine hydrolase
LRKRKRNYIGLISSVKAEGNLFIRNLRYLSKGKNSHFNFYEGAILKKDIVYCISGIGKTNAAHTATVLIQNYSPSFIINFGVGGSYPLSGLKTGDIAIATKEIYGDEGVLTNRGFQDIEVIGIPLLKKGKKRYFNEFELNNRLVKTALKASKTVAKAKAGTFVTVSTCTGKRVRSFELRDMYNAICENMEGAAVAHICTMYGTPLLEIRGISNIVDTRDITKWDIDYPSLQCQKIIMEILKTEKTSLRQKR